MYRPGLPGQFLFRPLDPRSRTASSISSSNWAGWTFWVVSQIPSRGSLPARTPGASAFTPCARPTPESSFARCATSLAQNTVLFTIFSALLALFAAKITSVLVLKSKSPGSNIHTAPGGSLVGFRHRCHRRLWRLLPGHLSRSHHRHPADGGRRGVFGVIIHFLEHSLYLPTTGCWDPPISPPSWLR